MRLSEVRKQTYYTVVFEQPDKKIGAMKRQTNNYVENLAWFRARVERLGGKIISESEPWEIEVINVSF